MTSSRFDPATVDRIISQGRALVRAIEALAEIQPTGWLERALARLLRAAYQERLRAIVETAPAWMSEVILSASEEIEEDRPAVWMSDN